jgi:hypothetical protein
VDPMGLEDKPKIQPPRGVYDKLPYVGTINTGIQALDTGLAGLGNLWNTAAGFANTGWNIRGKILEGAKSALDWVDEKYAEKVGNEWTPTGGGIKDSLFVGGLALGFVQSETLAASVGNALGNLSAAGNGAISTADTIPEGMRVSTARVTQPSETFIRYETSNPAFSKVTASGGVKPNTYAAPASEMTLPPAARNSAYNLPDPQYPRTEAYVLTPPAGTPIIGPRPVAGGYGNEVIFPKGYSKLPMVVPK